MISGVGGQNFFEKSSMNAMQLTAFRMMAAGFILAIIMPAVDLENLLPSPEAGER